MSKQLTTYLCEKPSQASELASFLGLKASHKRRNHYIDSSKGIAVCHAVGHLFELAPPEFYEPKLAKSWRSAPLPIIPEKFEVQLKNEMKGVFSVIQGLLKKTALLVIATDADNEGELIARDIISHAKYKGELKRALYSSTDTKALQTAFSNLKPASETAFMAKEADIRRKLDWVTGMNGTMAFTNYLKDKKALSKGAFSVGRVISALGMIVNNRELEIKTFVKQKYYPVTAICQYNGHKFAAKLKVPVEFADAEGRCTNRQKAEALCSAIKGKKFRVTKSEKTVKNKGAELPYDLASLQIDADRFGIESDETLSLLQTLYDKPLSAVTYPRTDCRYLPEGMLEDAKPIISHLNKIDVIKSFSLNFDKAPKAFNNKKVAIHHGIIPSKKPVNTAKLTDKQLVIYLLISLRYAQQFMKPYSYESLSVEMQAGKLTLSLSGTRLLGKGWKKAMLEGDKKEDEDQTQELINIDVGAEPTVIDTLLEDKTTSPPSRLTSGKLIEAMEHPERFELDPEVKKVLAEGDGIGTPATRSDAIKRAFKKGLIVKHGRYSKPSKILSAHAGQLDYFTPGYSALLQRTLNAVAQGEVEERALFTQNENLVRRMVQKWTN